MQCLLRLRLTHAKTLLDGTLVDHPRVLSKVAGAPVLMGAPNVVRGGSQSGNIAAQDLVEDGLCDGLVSNDDYPALSQAASALVDRGVCDLAAAWALISTNPAQIAGLNDRRHLQQGARAEVVAVNLETKRVELTFSAGRVAHLSGELVRRVLL